ncbi:hypothetical protein CEP54_014759 [Fusarium duplospermum]|uniref:Uncharacterized protein n=1 Tax=Fusarium duplospermum TaxID=1325734 RepID=A0A428NTZ9_9HYPO|nr:hypothetical protein CEP54_014759 [Fusarium duplospermum]
MANAGKSTERYLKSSSVKRARRFDRAYRGRWRYVVKLYLLMSSRIEKLKHVERRIWKAMHRDQGEFELYMENNLLLKKLRQQRHAVTLAIRRGRQGENKRGRDRHRAWKGFQRLARAIKKSDAVYFIDLFVDADDLGIEIFGPKKATQMRSFC